MSRYAGPTRQQRRATLAGVGGFLAGGLLVAGVVAGGPASAFAGSVAAGTTAATAATPAAPDAQPDACGGCWVPAPDTTWQYQLQGDVDTSIDADAYDIDGFDTPASVVDTLHADGRHAVCYVSAGSWERWRPDAGDFPDAVLGKKLDGWPGERWLDVRRIDVLGPIMAARLDMCVDKGFDAVEFDNVDGYSNKSGFDLSGDDQLAYDRWLADSAHDHGLSVGLKNDLGQIKALEPSFDFAVNEECFDFRECDRLTPFLDAGKAALIVEYDKKLSTFCSDADDLGAVAMRKKLSLKVWRQPCP